MIIYIQLFGGGGGTSGGNYKMTGHRLPDTYKPNSTLTRYNNRGIKKDKRWFDKNGEKHIDEHYDGPKNHRYPHKHYWHKDENGEWHRTSYEDWLKGVRKWKK